MRHQYWIAIAVGLLVGANAAASEAPSTPLPDELAPLGDVLDLITLEQRMPALPDEPVDLESLPPSTQAQLEAIRAELQHNSVTNGSVQSAVNALIQSVDLTAFKDMLAPLPASSSLLDALGLSALSDRAEQHLNQLAFLLDVASFEFVTVSDGVSRQHAALLNVPSLLDVDDQPGADVVATLRLSNLTNLQPDQIGVELVVQRALTVRGLLGGLTGTTDTPLPLDIRARLDLPTDQLTGGTEPMTRVELGLASDAGIPRRSQLAASLQTGAADLHARVSLTTRDADDALAIVGGLSQQNAVDQSYDNVFDLTVDLAPVPADFRVDAQLSDGLDVALNTSGPTSPAIHFSAPEQASGTLRIDQLPSQLNVFVGEELGDQIVRYTASAAAERIAAELALADGYAVTASLTDVPPAATVNLGDGSALDIDLGGAQIGEIAFTLTDGPAPRNVPPGSDGAVLDLRQGLVAGARFTGFSGLGFSTAPSLSAGASINTPNPVVFDVDLADGGFADLSFPDFPRQFEIAVAEDNMFGLEYTAIEAVSSLSLDTNLGLERITASLQPLPTAFALCTAQDNRCTGLTGGNTLDAALNASQAITLNGQACLEGPCSNPPEYFAFSPLTFRTLEVSVHLDESCIDVPFIGEQCLPHGSEGQIALNSDARMVAGDIDVDLGSTEVFMDGQFTADHRRLDYSALRLRFNRSGTLNCNPLNLDVIVSGTSIGDFIDPADLLCN